MRRMQHARLVLGIAAGLMAGSFAAASASAEEGVAPPGEEPSPQAEPPSQGGEPVAAIQDGVAVAIEYVLTVDGSVVDSSEGRGPLRYTQGRDEIIPGLERQLSGLHVGDRKDVTVAPEDGYGPVEQAAYVAVSKDQLQKDVTPELGMVLRGMGQDGRAFSARIREIGEENVTLDLNHPLAGKTLQFAVKIVEIAPGQ